MHADASGCIGSGHRSRGRKPDRPWLLGAFAALFVFHVASAGAQDAPPPKVTVAKPVTKDVVELDDFIGRFEALDQVDIRARVTGYVDKIDFTDGAVVKAGDLLFTIDP